MYVLISAAQNNPARRGLFWVYKIFTDVNQTIDEIGDAGINSFQIPSTKTLPSNQKSILRNQDVEGQILNIKYGGLFPVVSHPL